jgi:hypothetical protein
VALRDLTLAWFDAVHTFANDVQREREELRFYTTATLAWLEQESQSDGVAAESFGLITPEERLRGWTLPVESEALRRLPERVELLAACASVLYVLRIDQAAQVKEGINCNSGSLFVTQPITGLRTQHPLG